MRKLIKWSLICLILGCNQPEPTTKDNSIIPAISKDSLLSIIQSKSYTINKGFDFGYIKITAIGRPKFSNEIRFEYESSEYNTYFKYIKAERNEAFLSLNVDIASKITPKKKGVEMLSYADKYLPQVCLYKVDANNINGFDFIGRLEYKMANALPKHVTWYEEYFNYQEKGKILFYIKVSDSLKNEKLLITITNPDLTKNNSMINFANVVWQQNIE